MNSSQLFHKSAKMKKSLNNPLKILQSTYAEEYFNSTINRLIFNHSNHPTNKTDIISNSNEFIYYSTVAKADNISWKRVLKLLQIRFNIHSNIFNHEIANILKTHKLFIKCHLQLNGENISTFIKPVIISQSPIIQQNENRKRNYFQMQNNSKQSFTKSPMIKKRKLMSEETSIVMKNMEIENETSDTESISSIHSSIDSYQESLHSNGHAPTAEENLDMILAINSFILSSNESSNVISETNSMAEEKNAIFDNNAISNDIPFNCDLECFHLNFRQLLQNITINDSLNVKFEIFCIDSQFNEELYVHQQQIIHIGQCSVFNIQQYFDQFPIFVHNSSSEEKLDVENQENNICFQCKSDYNQFFIDIYPCWIFTSKRNNCRIIQKNETENFCIIWRFYFIDKEKEYFIKQNMNTYHCAICSSSQKMRNISHLWLHLKYIHCNLDVKISVKIDNNEVNFIFHVNNNENMVNEAQLPGNYYFFQSKFRARNEEIHLKCLSNTLLPYFDMIQNQSQSEKQNIKKPKKRRNKRKKRNDKNMNDCKKNSSMVEFLPEMKNMELYVKSTKYHSHTFSKIKEEKYLFYAECLMKKENNFSQKFNRMLERDMKNYKRIDGKYYVQQEMESDSDLECDDYGWKLFENERNLRNKMFETVQFEDGNVQNKVYVKNEKELQFLTFWNRFIMYVDKHSKTQCHFHIPYFVVPVMLLKFTIEYKSILREKEMRNELLAHAMNLYQFGLCETKAIQECMAIFDDKKDASELP